MIENTIIVLTPVTIELKKVGEIIRRFEGAGFAIEHIESWRFSPEEAVSFYLEQKGQPYCNALVENLTSGATVVVVLRGLSAISVAHQMAGYLDNSFECVTTPEAFSRVAKLLLLEEFGSLFIEGEGQTQD